MMMTRFIALALFACGGRAFAPAARARPASLARPATVEEPRALDEFDAKVDALKACLTREYTSFFSPLEAEFCLLRLARGFEALLLPRGMCDARGVTAVLEVPPFSLLRLKPRPMLLLVELTPLSFAADAVLLEVGASPSLRPLRYVSNRGSPLRVMTSRQAEMAKDASRDTGWSIPIVESILLSTTCASR